MMQIIRGTTPTITVNIRSNIDLTSVSAIWVYIYQQGSIVINKELSQVTINPTTKKITIILSQEDTLALRANTGALFQIRLLLNDNIALATPAVNVLIKEVYKDGIITGESTNG